MKRTRALKTIRTLAVALPLGFGESVEPEGAAPSVADLDPAGRAVAFVGAVLDESGDGCACASVLVRPGAGSPRIGPAEWRADSRREGRSEAIRLERKAGAAAPEGFEVWTGCAATRRAAGAGRVFVHLLDPAIAPGRRVIALEVDPGIWRWRSVLPLSPAPIDVEAVAPGADRAAIVVPPDSRDAAAPALPASRAGTTAPGS